jgi:hypothetical protein
MFFSVTELETLQVLGVEMSKGGSTESNVKSYEVFLTIYTKYLINKLSLLKKSVKSEITKLLPNI